MWGRPTSDGDSTQRSGWYFNFSSAGERQISGFAVFGNKLVFGSVIPPDAVADACGSGTGYQYSVNISTGNGSREVSQVGLLGEPFVLEVGDANVSISDSTGRRRKTTTGQIILQGSTGLKAISTQPTDQSLVGRLSWRQINNYQDLRNAP
jgi:type IV pilus assembly protein PilY1